MLTTKAPPCGLPKAILSKIGKRLGHCYGSTENVLPLPSVTSPLLTEFRSYSRLREECSQARLFLPKLVVVFIIYHPIVPRLLRISKRSPTQDQLISLIFSSILRTKQNRIPMPYFVLSSSSSAISPHLFVTFFLAVIHRTNLARDNPVIAHLHNASKTCSVYRDNHQRILLLMHSMNVPKRLGYRHLVKRP